MEDVGLDVDSDGAADMSIKSSQEPAAIPKNPEQGSSVEVLPVPSTQTPVQLSVFMKKETCHVRGKIMNFSVFFFFASLSKWMILTGIDGYRVSVSAEIAYES